MSLIVSCFAHIEYTSTHMGGSVVGRRDAHTTVAYVRVCV